MPRHTLSVLVENRPGVLARVTALISRRGFNIESVAEGATHDPRLSRITLVVIAGDRELEQVVKQIGKLVNVLKIVLCDGAAAVRRSLVLVTVEAGLGERQLVTEIARLFHGRIVDVSHDAVTVEASGSPDEMGSLVQMLERFEVREVVRSGTLAIGRAASSARAAGARSHLSLATRQGELQVTA